jgi:hypothetical protein
MATEHGLSYLRITKVEAVRVESIQKYIGAYEGICETEMEKIA